MNDDHRLARIEGKLDELDHKLDTVLQRLPTFVSWRALGAAVVAVATLAVGIVNLI